MNINYTEALILNFLLKNKDKSVNEYHIFKSIKKFQISSSDMVDEIIKLKKKELIDEVGEDVKKLLLTPRGSEYARNVVAGRLAYTRMIEETLSDDETEEVEVELVVESKEPIKEEV